jgi:hypothetical protein
MLQTNDVCRKVVRKADRFTAEYEKKGKVASIGISVAWHSCQIHLQHFGISGRAAKLFFFSGLRPICSCGFPEL